jgi:hypothetical protein
MSNDVMAQLKSLKLHGMASSWPELLAQSRHTEFEPERFMKQLLQAETAERQVRSIAYQMTAARFTAHRDLKDRRDRSEQHGVAACAARGAPNDRDDPLARGHAARYAIRCAATGTRAAAQRGCVVQLRRAIARRAARSEWSRRL